jgi:hypothetical protein
MTKKIHNPHVGEILKLEFLDELNMIILKIRMFYRLCILRYIFEDKNTQDERKVETRVCLIQKLNRT